jgi:Holliday junction DNA helicase RuvA
MFYYLDGTVTVIEPNLAVVDVGGVGYACNTTMNTLSHLEIGKKAKLYTYCNIKEDTFDIYGFYDTVEKRAFEMLISVSGVGPKAAVSILSSSTPASLAMSIINGNDKALTAAPGIGKKIAQRIILELKDKMSKDSSALQDAGFVSPAASTPGGKVNDVVSALTVLGYAPAEITSALRTIDTDSLTVEEIIRQVLKGSLK